LSKGSIFSSIFLAIQYTNSPTRRKTESHYPLPILFFFEQ
jgi:hypothetical protein